MNTALGNLNENLRITKELLRPNTVTDQAVDMPICQQTSTQSQMQSHHQASAQYRISRLSHFTSSLTKQLLKVNQISINRNVESQQEKLISREQCPR